MPVWLLPACHTQLMFVLPDLAKPTTTVSFEPRQRLLAVGPTFNTAGLLRTEQSCRLPFAEPVRRMAIPAEMTGNQLRRRNSSTNGQDIRMAAPNIDLDTFPEYLKHDCLLFFFPECEALAEKIAGLSPNVTLGRIKWG